MRSVLNYLQRQRSMPMIILIVINIIWYIFIHKVNYIDLLGTYTCFINDSHDLLEASSENVTANETAVVECGSKDNDNSTEKDKFNFSKFGRNYLMGYWGAALVLQVLDYYILGGAFSELLPILYKIGFLLTGAYGTALATAAYTDVPKPDVKEPEINSESLSESNNYDLLDLFDVLDLR